MTDTDRGAHPPLGPAVAFLRSLRAGLDGGSGLPASLAGAAMALPREARESLDAVMRRLSGRYEEDDWGLDEGFVEAAYPLLEFLYDVWWRVSVEGMRNVPGHGRAMLVANHAGILPWDAAMMNVALQREHPLPRHPRFLVLDWAFELPYVSVALRKLGGVAASPYNAIRLLEEDELVAVFPEAGRGSQKLYRDRYRLQRFGRGGFAEIALRTGAPIIPVAVVGSEEIHPQLAAGPSPLARMAGLPFFPITPTFPLFGPLGAVPLPSRWRIEFCEPIDTAHLGADAARDRTLVLELSERVRDVIQQRVYDNLVRRGPAFR
jgi:1-acyl-sn-glycerol-3-phosphate acyltransferase